MPESSSSNTPQAVNAETLNTMVDAMGALVMCLTRQMTPEQRRGVASDLARLSANASATGSSPLGALLSDLSKAANG